MQNIDPMLIEIEFRDGKRVNVLSIVMKDGIGYPSFMLEEYGATGLS